MFNILMIKKILILLILYLIYLELKKHKNFLINNNDILESKKNLIPKKYNIINEAKLNNNNLTELNNFKISFNYNINTNHIKKSIKSIDHKVVRLFNNYIIFYIDNPNIVTKNNFLRKYYLKNIKWVKIDSDIYLKLIHEDTFGKNMKEENKKSKLIINIPIQKDDKGNNIFTNFWINKDNIPSEKYDKQNIWINKKILSLDLKCLSNFIKLKSINDINILNSIKNGLGDNEIYSEPLKLNSVFYEKINSVL